MDVRSFWQRSNTENCKEHGVRTDTSGIPADSKGRKNEPNSRDWGVKDRKERGQSEEWNGIL